MNKVIPEDSVLVPEQATCVFKGQIFDVYQWPQEMFDGSTATFEMLKRADTVVMIAIVDDKLVVLDDEQPHRGLYKTFPGGRVDPPDASIEAAAQREMQEETGYSFNNWRIVKVTQPHRKMEWFVYVLLAWEVSGKQEPHLDPGEKINVELLDFNTVKQLVADKTGYLGESLDLFKNAANTEALLGLQEFKGRQV